ncbi:MAG: hypothetical protein OEW15_01175 [Nitrospirota bacterium]|nr:hypothetical protein [Nitrospirota bacterium]
MSRISVMVLLLCALAVMAWASEDCSKLGGRCRAACEGNEAAEAGAFEDCSGNEECCMPRSTRDAVGCCVRSFDRANFGPGNCAAPRNNACAQGSPSPVLCEKLSMCRK